MSEKKTKLTVEFDDETVALAKKIAKNNRNTVSGFLNQKIVKTYEDTFRKEAVINEK